MLRVIFYLIIMIGFSFNISAAQTPPDVLKAYKDYQALLKQKDVPGAKKKAYEAWQLAEDKMGDTETTANLAINYLDVAAASNKKSKKIDEGYARVIELASLKPEAERNEHITEQYYKHAKYLNTRRQFSKTRKIAQRGIDFAMASGLQKSTFLGELYTLMASSYVPKGDNEKIAEYTGKAFEVFETADDGYVTMQPLLARLYSGYAKEGQKNILDAALEYQQVMESVENVLPRNHPFMMRALGRWSSMRERLSRNGQLEEAEEKGLCQCWPYDKARNETVKPIKRVPPIMPARAFQSGFSIVEFDLTDDGGTENIEVLESWPPDVFDVASKRAVAKWRYSPRTEDQTDSDRTDIITTVRYRLADEFGNLIE